MADRNQLDLYNLLPALHRIQDESSGGALRELLAIVQQQADLLKENIDELYDDFFIETCADWVIPYIGDLVGNEPIYEVLRTRRADVARTLHYRRRKGTLPMLEELARDVTGWSTRAVAFFELVQWSQNVNHIRLLEAPDPLRRNPPAYSRVGTALVRDLDLADRFDGPFDSTAHSVDIRAFGPSAGWHGIRKVGFFLWRLNSYRLAGVTARQAEPPHQHGFHFNPLGGPVTLFQHPRPDASPDEVARESEVAGPIRPIAFHLQPGLHYGPGLSFEIVKDGVPVPLSQIFCMDLANWARPAAGKVGVDLRRGRISFAVGEEPAGPVTTTFTYGFSAPSGGGSYNRLAPVRPGGSVDSVAAKSLLNPAPTKYLVGGSDGEATISNAVSAWNSAGKPEATIVIQDNRTYTEDLALSMAGTGLAIQAANGSRPTIVGEVTVTDGTGSERLLLSGLLIAGSVRLQGDLGRLWISHCTLTPGRRILEDGTPSQPERPSLEATDSNDSLEIQIERSITGALRIPAEIVALTVRDSIVDAAGAGRHASRVGVLLSGNLSPFPTLSSAAPRLLATIGEQGPKLVQLAAVPTTLAQARDLLNDALRAAAPDSDAFASACVVLSSNRLAVTSGTGQEIWMEPAPSDPTAQELRLTDIEATRRLGLRGGAIDGFSGFSSNPASIGLILGTEGPVALPLNAVTTLPAARDNLQDAIRNASPSPSFVAATVVLCGDRLLVIPGEADVAPTFIPSAADPSSLFELALDGALPALAGSAGGELAGPPATLLETTLLGAVHVRELTLASNVIFADRVMAKRRQSGCVRFSWVPEGSQTPRRYRCQPDLALENVVDPILRTRIVNRLAPTFTSRLYGAAAYCQLANRCATEIKEGAENGSEMGAFNLLYQPQREANLRIRLEEYLPFGLEAGLIFET